MVSKRYERAIGESPVRRTQRLAPLLAAIAREIAERDEALTRLEPVLLELERTNQEASPVAIQLIAEAAVHRRELRRASAEVRRLGCALISRRPPTIYIPGGVAGVGGWLWQESRYRAGPR